MHVGDLARALLELLELECPGPLHVGGADDVSRYEFAVLLGADERRIERAQTSPDRAPDVTLDSSQAAALLATRLRGVREVLARTSEPQRSRGGAALGRREEVLERHVQQRGLALGKPLVPSVIAASTCRRRPRASSRRAVGSAARC